MGRRVSWRHTRPPTAERDRCNLPIRAAPGKNGKTETGTAGQGGERRRAGARQRQNGAPQFLNR